MACHAREAAEFGAGGHIPQLQRAVGAQGHTAHIVDHPALCQLPVGRGGHGRDQAKMSTAVLPVSQPSGYLRLWSRWVGATILGWAFGFWAANMLFSSVAQSGRDPSPAAPLILAFSISLWVGLAQWPILQPIVTRSAWWAVGGLVGLMLPSHRLEVAQ
jgi:hypothetical protein